MTSMQILFYHIKFNMNQFDIILFGAGSAGSIVANRLSKYQNLKILILEAGPQNYHPMIKIPLGYGMTFYNKSINWNFYTSPQLHLNNRKLYCPRGKVVGGSSSINAMVYTRGFPSDFQNWTYDDSSLWSWENIVKTYKKIEKNIILRDTETTTSKIVVNNVSSQHHSILNNYFLGAKELNIPIVDSFNAEKSEGVGHYEITTRNGFRWSAADGFLKETLKKNNVKLITQAVVQKLILKDKRVTGVKYLKNGKIFIVKANIGVIMAAGSIKTPHILMHSGIGPQNHLKDFGIKTKIDNSNVGANLQDHIGIDYLYRSKVQTLNKSLGTWSGRIKSILEYLMSRSGPLSLSVNQGGGFIRWKNKTDCPNLQIYFNPLSYSVKYANKRPLLKTDKFDGFIIGFQPCRPFSRGHIKLLSNEINDDPVIDPSYLSNEKDLYDLECGYDFIRKISQTHSLNNIMDHSNEIDPIKSSTKEMAHHFRQNASSIYHPCGTCKIGPDKNTGVVSNRLKVHGLQNLWIVDASVFPNITSGNINAPVMMTAYIGSNLISEDIKKLN